MSVNAGAGFRGTTASTLGARGTGNGCEHILLATYPERRRGQLCRRGRPAPANVRVDETAAQGEPCADRPADHGLALSDEDAGPAAGRLQRRRHSGDLLSASAATVDSHSAVRDRTRTASLVEITGRHYIGSVYMARPTRSTTSVSPTWRRSQGAGLRRSSHASSLRRARGPPGGSAGFTPAQPVRRRETSAGAADLADILLAGAPAYVASQDVLAAVTGFHVQPRGACVVPRKPAPALTDMLMSAAAAAHL